MGRFERDLELDIHKTDEVTDHRITRKVFVKTKTDLRDLLSEVCGSAWPVWRSIEKDNQLGLLLIRVVTRQKLEETAA